MAGGDQSRDMLKGGMPRCEHLIESFPIYREVPE